MALIAAAAAWAVAVAAAVAVEGHRVGGVVVPPIAYAVGLTVVALAALAGPPRREVSVPAGWRPLLGGGLIFGALYVFSGSGGAPGDGLTAVPALAGLLVPAVAVLWPRPAAVRGAVALSVFSLLARGTPATAHPLALAAMIGAAAVALVATSRVAAAAGRPLDPAAPPAAPRRVGAEAAAVAAVLVVGALLSTLVDAPPRPAPPSSGERAERSGGEAEPMPLAFGETLDPAGPGSRRSADVLLRIRAPRPDVWRAVTYDRWDGRRWRRTAGGPPGVVPDGARFVPVPTAPFRPGPAEDADQRVRVEASWAEVAVGAPQVRYFEVPGGAAVSPDGTVRLVPPLGRGATYQALSQRPVTTEAELRAAGAHVPEGGLADLLDHTTVSAGARALAAGITAGAPTAYDKVRALERWLGTNVRVDDDAPAVPPGTDPVDDVLFGRRAGPPERLAATLAVLARTVGVPSRLALGFLPGERPLFGGQFVVRARHAHAWVEVPFTGLGWQRFDPTGRIARAMEGDPPAGRLKRVLARWWPVLAGLVLAAVAVVVAVLARRRRRRLATPWATRCFDRLTRLGARRGRPRRAAETPAEYAAVLADGVLADERLRVVGEMVTAAAWSGREPPEESRRWADQVLDELTASGRRTGAG